jgi:dephospho-CoA kinase
VHSIGGIGVNFNIIGLCGGSGSGKGAVSAIIKERNIPSIDTDAVYRQLTSGRGDCMEALKSEFGESIENPDGSLNRINLRKIVFEGELCDQRRARLNEISHGFILDRTDEILSEYDSSGVKAAIVDAPLLFESGYDKKCDYLLAVTASEQLRTDRIVKRDGITQEEAKRRIKTQMSDEKLKELCDFFILNDGDFSDLEIQVKKVAEQILKQEGKKR